MRESVRAAFPAFTVRFEGRLPFMYLDVLGLVTTGVGNLIDPMAPALALPWVHKIDLTPATRPEVVAEWNTVKAAQALRRLGGAHFAQLTKLCLTDSAIDALMCAKLAEMEKHLRASPGLEAWDSFPAAAQLGILSMAWAMGPAFGFPHFRVAASREDWTACAAECKIVGPGSERNLPNMALFEIAAEGGDPDALS